MKCLPAIALAFCALPALCFAQNTSHDFPQQMVFARHTYLDVGPPFDFYEVLQLIGTGNETHIDDLLVTPPGDSCFQAATVETKEAVLQQSLKDLLDGKNPCAISEKSLRKEQKRCKHCPKFSGENITLNLSCGASKRRLRMDILDRDLFDSSPNTPQYTSWTMNVLAKIDKALGPGVWDRPVFLKEPTPSAPTKANPAILQQFQNGEFDNLFNSTKKLSEYYRDAQTTHNPPAVETINATPPLPVNTVLPVYPPIARAAHVEGDVTVHFVISQTGRATEPLLVDGPKLLEQSVKDAISKVAFPANTTPQQGEATFRFQLNCYRN